MSFHRSCYTARSPGYKYRTLSTNTGEPYKQRHKVVNPIEKKFNELSKAILSRVNTEVNKTHKARELTLKKFTKLDNKINSLIELQNTMTDLKKVLQTANFSLADMIEKVDKIEIFISQADSNSQQSRMTALKYQEPIKEDMEDHESVVTRI